jgi:hypothetical protein
MPHDVNWVGTPIARVGGLRLTPELWHGLPYLNLNYFRIRCRVITKWCSLNSCGQKHECLWIESQVDSQYIVNIPFCESVPRWLEGWIHLQSDQLRVLISSVYPLCSERYRWWVEKTNRNPLPLPLPFIGLTIQHQANPFLVLLAVADRCKVLIDFL